MMEEVLKQKSDAEVIDFIPQPQRRIVVGDRHEVIKLR